MSICALKFHTYYMLDFTIFTKNQDHNALFKSFHLCSYFFLRVSTSRLTNFWVLHRATWETYLKKIWPEKNIDFGFSFCFGSGFSRFLWFGSGYGLSLYGHPWLNFINSFGLWNNHIKYHHSSITFSFILDFFIKLRQK